MNHMRAIAKRLGLRLGESFRLTKDEETIYRFTELGLQKWNADSRKWCYPWKHLLPEILIGEYKIKRYSFNPLNTDGEYYTIFWNSFYPTPKVFKVTYNPNPTIDKHFLRYALGNCFETQEEAKEQVDSIMLKWKDLGIDGDLINGREVWQQYKDATRKRKKRNE